MESYNSEKLQEFLNKMPRKRPKLTENINNVEDSAIEKVIKEISNNNSQQLLPELSNYGILFNDENSNDSYDDLPDLGQNNAVLFARESELNIVRDEVYNRVLKSDEKFRFFAEKYQDSNINPLNHNEIVIPENINDPELRDLLKRFKFIQIGSIDSLGEWKQVIHRQTCKIILNTKSAEEFINAFEEISLFIKHVGQKFCSLGMTMQLSSDPTDNGIFVSFRKPSQYSSELMLDKFMTVAQSNSEFFASKYLTIELVGIISIQGGGGGHDKNNFRKNPLSAAQIILKKSSIIKSSYFMMSGDKNCFFISLALAIFYINNIKPPANYRDLGPKNPKLVEYKTNLCRLYSLIAEAGGVDVENFTKRELPGIPEYDKLQRALHNFTFSYNNTQSCWTYQIVIYSPLATVLYTGAVNCEIRKKKTINLVLYDAHFNYIKSLPGAFSYGYFCDHCFRGYSNITAHRKCIFSCSKCFNSPPCSHGIHPNITTIYCSECSREFYGGQCFKNHIDRNICQKIRFCNECGDVMPTNHVCGMFYCKDCQKNVEIEHNCTVAQFTPQNFKVKQHFYIFFDLETRTEKTERDGLTFVPVLCVSQIVCDDCLHIAESNYTCAVCGVRERVFKDDKNNDVIGHFLQYVFDKAKSARVTCISHNGSKFDSIFVLRKIYDTKRTFNPSVIAQGTKFFSIKMANVTFIDSLNFFPCALSKLPDLMGIEDKSKGFFPHHFNTRENQDYIGPFPEPHYYGAEEMKIDAKKKFEEWYETVKHSTFDMQKEMLKYCSIDVELLRLACIKFTIEMLEEAGFPVFQHAITIASLVSKIFRKIFYIPDSISITPISYRLCDNQSIIAIKFIIYLEMKLNISIQSAHNGREKIILCPPRKRYKVDGYFIDPKDNIPTVVEFHGCYFHGHSCILPNERVYLRKPTPSGHDSSNDDDIFENLDDNVALRRERTFRKQRDLEACGYRVISMYECEFRQILKETPNLDAILTSRLYCAPLRIRDSFFGGNVDATCTYYKVKEDEKIHYRDFTSLYPTVNMYDYMPTGAPKRIILGHDLCSQVDLSTFNGFLKVRVLPPRNLFFAVLPAKINNKLMFPLCYTCASLENPHACRHNDFERSFIGTFTSIEFKLALEKGYKAIEIFELQEFELRNDLFSAFIKHFYIKKLYASGAPKNIALDEYIEQYKQREGIDLDPNLFEKNPAKRSLAKLMLNTLWGKFGEQNKSTNEIINDPQTLLRLVASNQVEIKGLHIINDENVMITYEFEDPKPLKTSSTAIASFTTASARVRLYRLLDRLGKDALYFDTDAAIYKTLDDSDPRAPTGNFLGDLTDELECYGEGSYITEFTSGGPKNYAAKGICPKTGKTFEMCKVKGITLNYKNARIINFDTVFQQANNPYAGNVSVTDSCFVRDRDAVVRLVDRTKQYRSVLTKRRRVGRRTYPYGYDEALIDPLDQ